MTFELTLPDSGRTVRIRKVSPLLIMELRKQIPQPEPPTNLVDYGDGVKRPEPNPSDPSYLRALENYNVELEQKMRHLLIVRGVDCEINLEEVRELREFWISEYGKELPGTDKEIYVSYVVIGSDGDLELLINAILRRSQPTAEAVEAAVQTFRS